MSEVNKKTIVHVITTLNQGGAETMLRRLVNANKNYNHIIVVLKRVTTDVILNELSVPFFKINIHFHPEWILRVVKLLFYLRKNQPTIFMGWMYHGMLFSFFLALIFRTKLIFNFRQTLYDINKESFFTKFVIKVTKFMSYYCDASVYNSIVSKNQHENFGFSQTKSFFLPNGFSEDEYCFSEATRSFVRSSLGINDDETLIGVIARFHPMKGHQFFLETINEFIYENPNLKIKILLAGNNIDISTPSLIAIIDKCSNLKGKIHLLGPVKNSNEILSSLDLLCVPSLWGEGFPNIIGESLMSKVLAIGSDIGDTSTLLPENFVFPARSTFEFKKCLSCFFSKNRNELHALVDSLRNDFLKKYRISVINRAYEELFTQVINC